MEELNAIPSPNGASDRPPFSQQQSNQKATPAIFKIQQVISKILEQFDESFAQFIWLGEQFPGGSDSKESAYNAGDMGSIPRSGRSPEGGKGNPVQNSCLEHFMDKGAWWAPVHGATKLDMTDATNTHTHLLCHDSMKEYLAHTRCYNP